MNTSPIALICSVIVSCAASRLLILLCAVPSDVPCSSTTSVTSVTVIPISVIVFVFVVIRSESLADVLSVVPVSFQSERVKLPVSLLLMQTYELPPMRSSTVIPSAMT